MKMFSGGNLTVTGVTVSILVVSVLTFFGVAMQGYSELIFMGGS
jgi:hypothetical protein